MIQEIISANLLHSFHGIPLYFSADHINKLQASRIYFQIFLSFHKDLKRWRLYFMLPSAIYIYICKTQIYVQSLINVQSSNPDICPFSNSQICIQFSNLWPFLTFSNRRPMTSLTYALTLTNKSAIDLRIWKGRRFENTLISDHDLR